MEQKLEPNPIAKKQMLNKSLSYGLPHVVVMVGALFSILVWYIFLSVPMSDQLITHTFKYALPWILLIIGFSLTLLCSIAVHLAQLMRERSQTLIQIDQDFKKEIVERMRAEETKQKLEIALLQGQKLQAIGTLAGGIAHDFNNLLYAIIGYVEMARDDVAENSLVYNNLGKVLEAAKRGQDLVSRILAFGRRHLHHEFQPIHLKSIIESVLSLLKPTIPSSVIIDFMSALDDDVILGDQTQLHQVIVNIINNAVDAMDGEGNISIKVVSVSENDPFLNEFPDLKGNHYYRINISDTGHGMDSHTIERIFEPFYTTKEVGKGTGLGLSTVHAIIQEHLGGITVQSQLGVGTTFSILLPGYPSKEESHGNHSIGRG